MYCVTLLYRLQSEGENQSDSVKYINSLTVIYWPLFCQLAYIQSGSFSIIDILYHYAELFS